MKQLTIILLLISITCQAQFINKTYNPYEAQQPEVNYIVGSELKKDNSNIWVLGVFVFSIACHTIGDGLYDEGKAIGNQNYMIAGKAINAAGFTSLLALPFIKKFDKNQIFSYFIGYGCMRVAMFDPIYNGTRNLPINYIGNSSLWDKGLQKFDPSSGLLFARAVFLTAGVSITLRL